MIRSVREDGSMIPFETGANSRQIEDMLRRTFTSKKMYDKMAQLPSVIGNKIITRHEWWMTRPYDDNSSMTVREVFSYFASIICPVELRIVPRDLVITCVAMIDYLTREGWSNVLGEEDDEFRELLLQIDVIVADMKK